MRSFTIVMAALGVAACGDNFVVPGAGSGGPTVIIDSAPAEFTAQTHESVAFHASSADVTFACALDLGSAETCASPWTFDAVDGLHVVAVSATDALAETGTPATARFTVETHAPDTTITSGPNGVVGDAATTISFVSVPLETDATFACAFDSATFAPCSSPTTLSAIDGDHTFAVRATDGAGETDPSPATLAWTVDAAGPSITISEEPAALSSLATPTFAFSSTDPTVGFQCAIDGVQDFTTCSSPFVSSQLSDGTYTFHLKATNLAESHSQYDYTWTITTVKPTVTITSEPVSQTNNDTPQFAFTTSATTVLTTCRMDTQAAISPCPSGVAIGPLGDGPHAFTVTALDAATPPNTGSASYAFGVGGCGDGSAEGTEDCDGSDLAGQTCFGLGFTTGTLTCSALCRFDTSACTSCGNNVIEPGETCDAVQVGSATCATAFGSAFNFGLLTCNNTCTGFDDRFCSECGNGVAENREQCDGADTLGQSCQDFGFSAGTLGCTADCQIDTSTCTTCGDGVIGPGEACEPTDLDGQTCKTQGFTSGSLLCAPDCTGFDTEQCDTCGNGVIDGTEACDGSNLGGATCNGTLSCKADCSGYNTAACDGGFVADNPSFSGRVCTNGLEPVLTFTSGDFADVGFAQVAACTENTGVWEASLVGTDGFGFQFPLASAQFANRDGTTTPAALTGVELFVSATTGVELTSSGANELESFQFGQSTTDAPDPTWTGQTYAQRPFLVRLANGNQNYVAGWDPVTKHAFAMHGALKPTTAAVEIDAAATGTVTALTSGAASLRNATDVHLAVYGHQPAADTSSVPDGAAATGGIYWTCDNAVSYVEHDTGLSAADKKLVYTLAADPNTFDASAARLCPTTGMAAAAVTDVMYAGLLGGSSLYKTTDGGATWAVANTGLPAGASVFSVAIDCAVQGGAPEQCADEDLVYAATSGGLFESTDAGASWHVLAFAGKAVRALAISPAHVVGQRPRMFVGVDDAHVIYDRNVGDAVP
nr:hypothetical protein [Kofleriaceae bacterium]